MSKLIEKNRDINVDHDWWDCVYENFIEDMTEIGVTVGVDRVTHSKGSYEKPAIYFSGFWSQGDGASFEGYIADWDKFFLSFDEKYKSLKKQIRASWTVRTNSHTMSFDVINDIDPNPFDPETQHLQYIVDEQRVQEVEQLFDDFEKELIAFIISKASELYDSLEQEYEYLTSDDAVFEILEANGEIDENNEDTF